MNRTHLFNQLLVLIEGQSLAERRRADRGGEAGRRGVLVDHLADRRRGRTRIEVAVAAGVGGGNRVRRRAQGAGREGGRVGVLAVEGAGPVGDGNSESPALSEDGTRIAYDSDSNNLGGTSDSSDQVRSSRFASAASSLV